MRTKLIYLLNFFLVGGIAQQSLAQTSADSLVTTDKQRECIDIYHRAIKYNDYSTAAFALVQYLNAGGHKTYQDTLAIVYYNQNNLGGAYKLANELYTENNKNVTALTLLADISSRGGEAKISLEWYEKLCALSPSPYNFYQLGSKQFILERRLECRQSLQKVIADSVESAKQTVSLEVSNGYFEQVPVLAASYNMLAVLAFQDKKTTEAEALYKKALEIAPNFVIAKQNLDSLKGEGNAKPAAKTQSASKAKG
jgi:tetratricopeptide (TPR) repeat protein